MKDWKRIAEGQRLAIPEADLERASQALDALESVFRPLVRAIPEDVEPAVIFHAEDGP